MLAGSWIAHSWGQPHLEAVMMLPLPPVQQLPPPLLLLLLQHHLTLLFLKDKDGNGIPVKLLLTVLVKVQAPNAALSHMTIIIIRSKLQLPFVPMLMELWFHWRSNLSSQLTTAGCSAAHTVVQLHQSSMEQQKLLHQIQPILLIHLHQLPQLLTMLLQLLTLAQQDNPTIPQLAW